MNKKLLTIIILFCAAFNSHAGIKHIGSVLKFKTNLGFSDSYEIRINGNTVYVDGSKLDRTYVIANQKYITFVLSTQKMRRPATGCPAGEFIHVAQLGNLEKTEIGCLDDERFGALSFAFRKLKAASLLSVE